MRQNIFKKGEEFHQFLMEISKNHKTISFIGPDRASGKTTTLKAFLQALKDRRVGVTSIGTDHQSIKNPKEDHRLIYISEGTVVATSRNSLNACDTTKEILHTTGIQTPSGEIIIFKAKSAGHVFLAGPSMIADSIRIRDLLFAAGAEFVLIDGAVDRKSSAFPGHTDAIVYTASLFWQGEDCPQDLLTREIGTITTPVVEDENLREICLQHTNKAVPYFIVDVTGRVSFPQKGKTKNELITTLSHFDKDIQAIYIEGALTNSFIAALIKADKKITARLADTRIIVEDPTKLFVSPSSRLNLLNMFIHLRVLKPIKILAISLIPCKTGMDKDQVKNLLKDHADRFHLPVIDSMGGIYVEGI